MIENQGTEQNHLVTAEIQVNIRTTSCRKATEEFSAKMVQLFNDFYSDPGSKKTVQICAYEVKKVERNVPIGASLADQ